MKIGPLRCLLWGCVLSVLGANVSACKRGEDPPPTSERKAPKKRKPKRLSLDDHLKRAIKQVKVTRNINGFPIHTTLKHLRTRAVAIAKKQQLPPPSPFEWRGACSGPNTCKVMVEFWDGKNRMVAQWMVRGKKIEPIDTLAQGLMNPKIFAPKKPVVRKSIVVVKKPIKRWNKRRRYRRRRRRYRRRRRRRRRRRN